MNRSSRLTVSKIGRIAEIARIDGAKTDAESARIVVDFHWIGSDRVRLGRIADTLATSQAEAPAVPWTSHAEGLVRQRLDLAHVQGTT